MCCLSGSSRFRLAILLMVMAGITACQKASSKAPLEPKLFADNKQVAVAPKPVADQGDAAWGTIKGQIVYDGDPVPQQKALNVSKDQEHCLGKGPILSEDWVVNKQNKGVRWTFVWLAPEPGGRPLPIHPTLKDIQNKEVEIDQPRYAFVPHCLAMREGQVLVAKNRWS